MPSAPRYTPAAVSSPPDGRDSLDDGAYDRRGRARPLYASSSRGATTWRPGRMARLALGLVPGLRVMAVSSTFGGLPYLVLGLTAIVLGGLLALEWELATENVRTLHIREVFLLVHAGAIVLAAAVFEMLRFGASLEERYYGSRAPRLLASLLLPALIVLFGGPEVVRLWPRLVEAAWMTAAVIVLGAVPAAIWTAAEGFLASHERLRRFQLAVGGVLASGAVLGVIVVLTFGARLSAWAADVGFVLLPRLLAG